MNLAEQVSHANPLPRSSAHDARWDRIEEIHGELRRIIKASNDLADAKRRLHDRADELLLEGNRLWRELERDREADRLDAMVREEAP